MSRPSSIEVRGWSRDADGVTRCVAAMRRWPCDLDVQRACCAALGEAACAGTPDLLSALARADAAGAALSALARWPRERAIAWNGSAVVGAVAAMHDGRATARRLVRDHAAECIAAVVTAHDGHFETAVRAIGALVPLARAVRRLGAVAPGARDAAATARRVHGETTHLLRRHR